MCINNRAIVQSSNHHMIVPGIIISGQITSLGSQDLNIFILFFLYFCSASYSFVSLSPQNIYDRYTVPRVHRSSSVAYQTGVIGRWAIRNPAFKLISQACKPQIYSMEYGLPTMLCQYYNKKCILIGRSHFLNCIHHFNK